MTKMALRRPRRLLRAVFPSAHGVSRDAKPGNALGDKQGNMYAAFCRGPLQPDEPRNRGKGVRRCLRVSRVKIFRGALSPKLQTVRLVGRMPSWQLGARIAARGSQILVVRVGAVLVVVVGRLRLRRLVRLVVGLL